MVEGVPQPEEPSAFLPGLTAALCLCPLLGNNKTENTLLDGSTSSEGGSTRPASMERGHRYLRLRRTGKKTEMLLNTSA